MQHTLKNILFFLLLASSAAFADGQAGQALNHEAMKKMDMAQMKAMPLVDGVVKKIDQKGGKITLKHGKIASVKMPAMTMGYRVKQPQQLESIQPGGKVRFMMEKMGDDYIVTHIEPAR